MSIRKVPIAIGEFYHIYNRGVDKRKIFLDDSDRRRFVKLLYSCNGTNPVIYKVIQTLPLEEVDVGDKIVAIGSYTLMPNHFHIQIKEIVEGGTVKFISKLLTAYSKYFNKRYERTGALFESEFKSRHLNTDEYLKYIFAYINLNPLKLFNENWRDEAVDTKQAHNFLRDYRFSSYLDHLEDKREENLILNTKEFPEYFPKPDNFVDYINEWINFEPVDI